MTLTQDDSAMGAPVKDFLNNLSISETPTVFEVNGRRVYILVRPPVESTTRDEWTSEMNHRRHDLVLKEIAGSLTFDEAVELADLNMIQDRWLDRVAPLPFEHVRRLHDQLVGVRLANLDRPTDSE